jgi:hypothetical protein
MRTPSILVTLLVLAAACPEPFPCNRYCWSHQQYVPDLTGANMTGDPDGRFDMHCELFSSSEFWYPPLPPFGWYSAEICIPSDDHEIVSEIVAAIQDPTIDASTACDVTELELYAALVQALALQARDACVAHLTCNGAPAGCDIDPTEPDSQACQIPKAIELCDQVVLAPALAALTDLSNGPGAAQPQQDGTVIEYVDDPLDCEQLSQDTDGMPVCGGMGGGDGLDESTTADGGTSSTGESSGSST